MTSDPDEKRQPQRTSNRPGRLPEGGEPTTSQPSGLLQPRSSLRPLSQTQPAARVGPARGRPADRAVVQPPPQVTRPYTGPDESVEEGLLRNPYVLAGLAVAGAILLAVFVVVLFGGGGDGPGGPGGEAVAPLTPLPGRGVAARSIATATVREGPNAEYLEIGLLRSGQDVEVVGRNADASWFQIFYPPQSQLSGWVPSSALRIPEAAAENIQVVAVTPIPRPTVIQPTPEPLPTETVTPTPATTGTPGAGGPDIAVAVVGNACEAGLPLVVTVGNAGTSPILGREIRLIVSNVSGVLSVANISAPSLDAGASIPVQTNQVVQAPRTSVRVELLGAPSDVNPNNNEVDCVIRGGEGAPAPTRTPRNRD